MHIFPQSVLFFKLSFAFLLILQHESLVRQVQQRNVTCIFPVEIVVQLLVISMAWMLHPTARSVVRHLALTEGHNWHQRNISWVIFLKCSFRVNSHFLALLLQFFRHGIIGRVKCNIVAVDFRAIEVGVVKVGAIFWEASLSLFNIFVVAFDFFFFFALFFFLFLFLSFFGSFTLLHLFVEDALHLSAFSFEFGLLAVVELLWEGSADVALLFEFLGLFGVIHVRMAGSGLN